MEQVKIQPIMVGKDRVVLRTIDGQTLKGTVITMRLPDERFRFLTDEQEEIILPISSIDSVEKAVEH